MCWNVEEWARKVKIENVGQMSDMIFDNRQVTYRSNILSVRWGVINKTNVKERSFHANRAATRQL